jgi:hypothetical protein
MTTTTTTQGLRNGQAISGSSAQRRRRRRQPRGADTNWLATHTSTPESTAAPEPDTPTRAQKIDQYHTEHARFLCVFVGRAEEVEALSPRAAATSPTTFRALRGPAGGGDEADDNDDDGRLAAVRFRLASSRCTPGRRRHTRTHTRTYIHAGYARCQSVSQSVSQSVRQAAGQAVLSC